jgi:hypothetical protein
MPPLAAVPDLQHELDVLYATPLEEFTKARNDLAARLRKAHQGDAAAEVRSLRKPSVVAWAANRLARTEPQLVRELLDAGARLRDVQQGALAGRQPGAEVADAAAAERELVRALVVAARAELEARASPALLDRLAQTLRAAAVDPGAAALLQAGRLTEELQAVGFGPLEAVAPRRRPDTDEVRRAARERVSALRAEARRLSAEVREAAHVAEEAVREAERLRAAVELKRVEAEQVAAELAEAENDLRARR